jgi:tetratricopeptide (TPR) repeat protein
MPVIIQLYYADYRVRDQIFFLLKRRASKHRDENAGSSSSRKAAFELALCCALGFGVTQSDEDCKKYLKQSRRAPNDLELEIRELRFKKVEWQFNQLGVLSKMQARGYTTTLDYAQYYSKSQLEQAQERYHKEIDGLEIVLGDNHDIVLILKSILGVILRGMGRWSQVEEIEQQLAQTASEKLGEEHPYTLTCLADLASSLMPQKRWKEAEKILIRVLEKQMKVLGPENPATLVSMGNLSMTLSSQGRFEEGDELLSQVIDIQKRVFGADHPVTRLSIENLAPKISNQKLLQERQEELGTKVRQTRKMLGVMHETTSESMLGLAATHISQKRWDEAEVTLVRTIDMQKAELGDTHFYTLASIKILGFVMCIQGKHDEGEALVVHVMETLDREFGPEFPYTRDTMALLALRYRNEGRWEELKILELRFAGCTEMAGVPIDAATRAEDFDSLSNLASAYERQGRWTEAEQIRLQIIEGTKALLGDRHLHTLRNMEVLGMTYCLQSRWQEGEALLAQGLSQGVEHEGTARSIEFLSALKKQRSQLQSNQGIFCQVIKEDHKDSSSLLQHIHTSIHGKNTDTENRSFPWWVWKEIESLEKALRQSRPAVLESRELAMRPAQRELFDNTPADATGKHAVAEDPKTELQVEKPDSKSPQVCRSPEHLALDSGNDDISNEEAVTCESPEPVDFVSGGDGEVGVEATDMEDSNTTTLSDAHIMPWEDRVHGTGLDKLLSHRKKRATRGRRLEAATLMKLPHLEAKFAEPGLRFEGE